MKVAAFVARIRAVAVRLRPGRGPMFAAGLLLAPGLAVGGPVVEGLPFTRFHSFEEIGNVSRGAQLGFDRIGRLAVIDSGSYVVLNDTTWLDLADKSANDVAIQTVVFDRDGRGYYGAFGSWGTVEFNASGTLRAHSLVPRNYPPWVLDTTFSNLLLTRQGVYFAGANGVVFLDRKTESEMFFRYPDLTRTFSLGDRVFAASRQGGIQVVNTRTGVLENTPIGRNGITVDQAVALGSNRVLVATDSGRLMTFDGERLDEWRGALGRQPNGRVSALQPLRDGTVAIAINGRGLFFATADGDIERALVTPEYQRIVRLATHEPGVLWAVDENGIERILYGSPVTMFGQRLGLPIGWPQVVRCAGRIFVASSGRLYEAMPDDRGSPATFQLAAGQPTGEIWGIAATQPGLLVGNASGVFRRDEAGRFIPVLTDINVARLAAIGTDTCLVLGTREITALRWHDHRWSEIAPRVPGLGYPALVHTTERSAWLELGANRAARVAVHDGRIETRAFDRFPWTEPRWINIGSVGNVVVLSGPTEGRVFFDDARETFCAAPELRRLLDAAPHWIARVAQDDSGAVWAAHDQGIVRFRRNGTGFQIERNAFDVINNRLPILQVLPGSDVWVSSGESLYHVDVRSAPGLAPATIPILVSATDVRTEREIADFNGGGQPEPQLSYGENALSFRFFAGGYAFRRPPVYKYRITPGGATWLTLTSGSVLALPQLREGGYEVEVKLAETGSAIGRPLTIRFHIDPPWYRTWYAYSLYGLGAIIGVCGVIAWAMHHARTRNRVLEGLVLQRADELRAAMARLKEETENAATLAERNRLAGEIHDSIEQGFSGVILQLDTTAKISSCPPEIRSGLALARNMVAFSRNEIRHAVWDLNSPVLEAGELSAAIRNIVAQVAPEKPATTITVAGPVQRLNPTSEHHLLRIAQEAIANAAKHAAAERIEITLTYSTADVRLVVSDDGRGFEPETVIADDLGHFGLRSLRGRARKINGRLRIISRPGAGTYVEITVPLQIPTP